MKIKRGKKENWAAKKRRNVFCRYFPGWEFKKLLTKIHNIFLNFKVLSQSNYP